VNAKRKRPSIEPRGLSVPQAAAYIGISPSAYRYLMRDGKVPQPVTIPGFERIIIDRAQLDAALDRLSGVECSHDAPSIVQDDPTWT
jgi:predicted DNA-binding transcriptional regulator AlpA